MTEPLKVSGFIAAANNITLFMSDGSSKVLANDGWETKRILEAVTPALAAIPGTPVVLDLDQYLMANKIKEVTGGKVEVAMGADGGNVIQTKHGPINDGGALTKHIEEAAYGDGAKGFKRFMEKFGEIKRKHTAQELLAFMKGADLPIADDGSIIGFKILKNAHDGTFRDPYTGKIPQKLGSLVYMPDSKVDDDRRNLCSTGLHVCSRSYIRGFTVHDGVLTLVKVQPKDVISVPMGETSKMRDSAYHIVAVIPNEIAHAVGRRSASEDCKKFNTILADVIAGNHPPVLERVQVTGYGDFTVTAVETSKPRRERRSTVRRALRRPGKIDPKAVKAMARKAAGPKTSPYDKKLARAQAFFDKGKSMRWISVKLNMDRESLSKNLTRSKRKA